MAWNDPFETQVDSLVEELGQFLQKKSALEVMDIMQIQEICRDFCNFLCKDVRKATKRDYTVYTQLHAFTPEEEQEYYVKLSYIKEFCDENPENQVVDSETQLAFQVRGRKPSMSLSERALMRERRATLAFEADPVDLLKELMIPDSERASQDHTEPVRDSNEAMAAARNLSPQRDFTDQERQESVQATPKKPLRAVSKEQANDLTQRTHSEKDARRQGSSDSLSGISERTVESDPQKIERELARLDGMFGDESRTGISVAGFSKMLESESVAIPMQSESFLKIKQDWEQDEKRREIAQEQEPPEREQDITRRKKRPVAPEKSLNETQEVLETAGQEEDIAANTRDVDGIQYDFSSENIRKMREFEKKKAKEVNAVDKGDALDGFRPYLFDAKYLIDVQLPDMKSIAPVKVSPINHYVMPLAPALVLLALSAVMFTLATVLGLVFLLLGIACIVAVLADILPASQQTPQAAIMAYLNARQGRCYGRAMSLLALTESAAASVDLHEVWAPENSWPTAILKRFRPVPAPETRLVSSTAKKDAQVLIYTALDKYYLVPVVRMNEKWFIASPQIVSHEIP